jgi:hypothetical protein
MEDADLTDGDLLSNKIKINLHMLGVLILNGVGGEVHDADIITVDKCALTQQSDFSQAVCNVTILGISAGAGDDGLPLGRPRNQVVPRNTA